MKEPKPNSRILEAVTSAKPTANQIFPSRFSIGEEVFVDFHQSGGFDGKIYAVGFTESKVWYDIEVLFDSQTKVVVRDIRSEFVVKRTERACKSMADENYTVWGVKKRSFS